MICIFMIWKIQGSSFKLRAMDSKIPNVDVYSVRNYVMPFPAHLNEETIVLADDEPVDDNMVVMDKVIVAPKNL